MGNISVKDFALMWGHDVRQEVLVMNRLIYNNQYPPPSIWDWDEDGSICKEFGGIEPVAVRRCFLGSCNKVLRRRNHMQACCLEGRYFHWFCCKSHKIVYRLMSGG